MGIIIAFLNKTLGTARKPPKQQWIPLITINSTIKMFKNRHLDTLYLYLYIMVFVLHALSNDRKDINVWFPVMCYKTTNSRYYQYIPCFIKLTVFHICDRSHFLRRDFVLSPQKKNFSSVQYLSCGFFRFHNSDSGQTP